MNWTQNILIFGVRVYQRVLSPMLAGLFGPTGRCRFEPSCSHYAATAIQIHGATRGSALAIWRICRCHPWGGGGFDPVPDKLKVQNSRFKVGEEKERPAVSTQKFEVPSSRFKVGKPDGKFMSPYGKAPQAIPNIFHGS